MNEKPTDDEINTAAKILAKLEPGYLPFPIFREIERLVMAPIVEIVPLRRKEGRVEILLIERPDDDVFWPNQLHTPGTVLRPTDSLESALERLFSKELANVHASKPKFVKNIVHHSGRGMEASQIYWVEISGEASIGQFYDANNLPDNLMRPQLDFIPAAVADYELS